MDELNSGDVEIYKFPVNDEKEAELNSSMNVSANLVMLHVVHDYLYM